MNLVNKKVRVFCFLLLTLFIPNSVLSQTLDPASFSVMSTQDLEQLLATEFEKMDECIRWASIHVNGIDRLLKGEAFAKPLSDEETIELIEENKKYLAEDVACIKMHRENLRQLKKEINSRLKGVVSDDPDRGKLKKAQGDTQSYIRNSQQLLAEIKAKLEKVEKQTSAYRTD